MSKQKDMSQRILEDIPEVFADIVNVLLFDGKEVIKEDELEDSESRSQYKFAGKYHEQERDVSKYWKNAGIRIACCGFENQTKPDKYMPLRVISYDGGSYRSQLLRNKKEAGSASADKTPDGSFESQKINTFPVITLVLYFGTKKRWSAPKSLLESLDVIPPELENKVNDYKIDVHEIAFLPRETIDSFKSDFWFVADYFWQMKNNKNYKPSEKQIKYAHAIMQAMSAFTGDKRFEDEYNEVMKEGGGSTMCEVLDRVEERGRKAGIEEGRREMCEVLDRVEERGRKAGIEEGRREMCEELDRVEERGRKAGIEEGRSEMIHIYITNCEASGKAPETIISELKEFFNYSVVDAQAIYDEYKESR